MDTLYRIYFLFLFIFLPQCLSAQLPDYYSGKSTVTANGNTYKIKTDDFLRIQNINNYKMDHPYDSEGDPAPGYQVVLKKELREEVDELVRSVFPKEEIEALIKENLAKVLYFGFVVDDRSGKVLEVSFIFLNTPLIRTIKPDKLSYLEQRLKEIITYPHDPGSSREFHLGTGINISLDKLYEGY